jgi:outer membrane protein assembly factor BamB
MQASSFFVSRGLLALTLGLGLLTGPRSVGAEDPHAPFVGRWVGTVTAPNATAEIGFTFTRSGERLLASADMPAMFLHGAKLGAVTVSGSELRIRPLDTTLRLEGEQLAGSFGLSHLPIRLARSERALSPLPSSDIRSGPPPKWRASLRAEVWASPVVAEATVYLGAADGKFHALDASSGRMLWSWSGPHPIYGTALVTRESVVFVDARQDLVCLRRHDGDLRWRRPVHDPAGGPLPENETFNRRTVTPLLHSDNLYLGSSDGALYAIDPTDGAVRFRHEVGAKIYATVGVDAVSNELLLAGLDGSLITFDAARQSITRRTKLPGALTTTPLVAGDRIIVGCRNFTLYGLRRSDLTVAWEYSFWFSWIESTPALIDGTLYVGGSDYARISALDPSNGQARWSTVVNGLSWGTPLVTRDAVYAGTSAQAGAILPHTGALVSLDRPTGQVRWRTPVPLNAPATRAGVIGSLARHGDLVIAAQFDGTVTAF